MPAFGNIVINDGKATPVAHTFGPLRIDEKAVATYLDRAAGVGIGFGKLAVSLRSPMGNVKPGDVSDAAKRVYKAVLTLDLPTLESVSTVPTVAYVHQARVELTLPERGTLADRKDLLMLLRNALANTSLNSVFETLESVY